MATTDITLTPARLTAITGLTGLRVECSSAPARGMAGDAVGVGVAGATVEAFTAGAATTADAATTVDGGTTADAATPADRSADTMGEADSTAPWAEVSTVAVVGASTVAVVEASTVAVVEDPTAAEAVDTGKPDPDLGFVDLFRTT